MKKLHYLIFAAIVAFSFSSCKKIEGCMDPLSLNYNPDATKDNHDCDYSTVNFYASGDSINGKKVLEIVIRVGLTSDNTNEYIGNITSFNQAIPDGCSNPGTVNYSIQLGESHTWNVQYNLTDNDIALKQGSFSPSPTETCITIDLLP